MLVRVSSSLSRFDVIDRSEARDGSFDSLVDRPLFVVTRKGRI